MLKFKEYSQEFDVIADSVELTDVELTSINEVLDTSARIKKKQQFIRRSARIQLAKKMQSHRLASTDRIKQRAKTRARNILIKRLYQGRSRSDIPLAQRKAVDIKLARMKNSVNRLSRKLIRRVKQDDIRRKTHANVGSGGNMNQMS